MNVLSTVEGSEKKVGSCLFHFLVVSRIESYYRTTAKETSTVKADGLYFYWMPSSKAICPSVLAKASRMKSSTKYEDGLAAMVHGLDMFVYVCAAFNQFMMAYEKQRILKCIFKIFKLTGF